jgi:hypothetical protein
MNRNAFITIFMGISSAYSNIFPVFVGSGSTGTPTEFVFPPVEFPNITFTTVEKSQLATVINSAATWDAMTIHIDSPPSKCGCEDSKASRSREVLHVRSGNSRQALLPPPEALAFKMLLSN